MAVKKGAKKKKAARPAKRTAKKPVKKAVKSASDAKTTTPVRRLSAVERKRNQLLKQALLKKRNEIVQDLEIQMGRKLVRETGQKIDSAMDSADLSALDMDQGIDYSLLEMKYGQYKDIADAFRKLQNNTYGQCEECDEEIDIKRLAVNPLARYCIPCKTKKEAMENIQKEETRFKE